MTIPATEEVTQALLPCPFCGNDGRGPIEDALHVSHSQLVWRPSYDSYTVQCDRCSATMGYSDSEEEAIAAWNTRLSATPPVPEVAVPDTRSADVPVPRAVYERGGWTDGRWGQAYDLVEAALLAAGHTRPCEHPVLHMLEMEGNS